MKRILIVNNNMHIGGIQKSLVNLLNELCASRADEYKIDLLLWKNAGELSTDIPGEITIIEGNFFTQILGMSHSEARQSGILTLLHRSFWAVITRLLQTRVSFCALSHMQRLRSEYDCAISFMQNGAPNVFYGGCAEFVLNTAAKEKICFIHCDFQSYGGNCAYNRKTLERFDKIAAVSDSVAKRLVAAVPSIANKVRTVHNCTNFGAIQKMSDEYAPEYANGRVNLFTAARLHTEKGILRMLPILKRIKESGAAFVWRIGGDGPDRTEIEEKIAVWGLQNEIILLGSLPNPYPYFKHSDAVLVPSYNEAAPMVFDEARAFGTPIFTTETASAKEMVSDTHSGIVCENTDEKIESELLRFILNFVPHKNKVEYCDNRRAVSEFDDLIHAAKPQH